MKAPRVTSPLPCTTGSPHPRARRCGAPRHPRWLCNKGMPTAKAPEVPLLVGRGAPPRVSARPVGRRCRNRGTSHAHAIATRWRCRNRGTSAGGAEAGAPLRSASTNWSCTFPASRTRASHRTQRGEKGERQAQCWSRNALSQRGTQHRSGYTRVRTEVVSPIDHLGY